MNNTPFPNHYRDSCDCTLQVSLNSVNYKDHFPLSVSNNPNPNFNENETNHTATQTHYLNFYAICNRVTVDQPVQLQ